MEYFIIIIFRTFWAPKVFLHIDRHIFHGYSALFFLIRDSKTQ